MMMNEKLILLTDDGYDLNDEVEPETDFKRWKVFQRGKKAGVLGGIVSLEIAEEGSQAMLDKGIGPDEMLPPGKHYGIRGGIALRRQITDEDWERIKRGETMVAVKPESVLIRLAPDVSETFMTSEAVNEALRQLIREKKAA